MATRKETMDSEAALVDAMCRAMGPYLAQVPGAYDTTASGPDSAPVLFRIVYRRCGQNNDGWVRDQNTNAAVCMHGDPEIVADERLGRWLLGYLCGYLRSMAILGGSVRLSDVGEFYVGRLVSRYWTNPKNGKRYLMRTPESDTDSGWRRGERRLCFKAFPASKWPAVGG